MRFVREIAKMVFLADACQQLMISSPENWKSKGRCFRDLMQVCPWLHMQNALRMPDLIVWRSNRPGILHEVVFLPAF